MVLPMCSRFQERGPSTLERQRDRPASRENLESAAIEQIFAGGAILVARREHVELIIDHVRHDRAP